MKISLLSFCFALAITLFGQTPGTLDTGFGTTGLVSTPFGASPSEAFAVAVQPDGKIVCAGNYTTGGNARIAFARYLTNGTLDTGFGVGGKVQINTSGNSIIRAIHINTNGTIIGAGVMANKPILVRLLANGTADPAFGSMGQVTFDGGLSNIADIKVDGAGKITGCGRLSTSPTSLVLFRRNADGTADNTFGTAGFASVPTTGNLVTPTRIAFQNNKILICGFLNTTGTNQKAIVSRVTSTGAVDNTFGTGGTFISAFGGTNEFTDNMVINSEGKVVCVGRQLVGTTPQILCYRLSVDGALDNTFGTAGKVNYLVGTIGSEAPALLIQSDGKILVAGTSTITGGKNAYIMRLTKTGQKDSGFGTAGQTVLTATGFANISGLAIQPSDRKIVCAGLAPGTTTHFAVYRFHGGTYTSTDEPSILESAMVYPNPAQQDLNYQVELQVADQAQINLVSLDGRSITTLEERAQLVSGMNTLKFVVPSHLPAGTYLLQVKGNRFHDAQMVIID